jgi:hypothetical protein
MNLGRRWGMESARLMWSNRSRSGDDSSDSVKRSLGRDGLAQFSPGILA